MVVRARKPASGCRLAPPVATRPTRRSSSALWSRTPVVGIQQIEDGNPVHGGEVDGIGEREAALALLHFGNAALTTPESLPDVGLGQVSAASISGQSFADRALASVRIEAARSFSP